VADQYAANGYLALSPAIFDRVERDVELGYDEAGMNKGRELRAKLDLAKCMVDIQATIDTAASAGKVAALGYCWGGSLAYISSARLVGLACAVGYYGAQIAAHSSEVPHVPVLLHYAEKDEYIRSVTSKWSQRLSQPSPSINIREQSTVLIATTGAFTNRKARRSLANEPSHFLEST